MRTRFVTEGLDAAINDRPRPGRRRKLDGRQEAHLVAITCSDAPEGHTNWTLQLLADKVVAMEFAESISLETIRQILKKTNSNHGRTKSGAFPEFVARILDLYHEERDPEWPVVCFDETSKQLIEDVRPPIEAAPGRVERYDTESGPILVVDPYEGCRERTGNGTIWNSTTLQYTAVG